MYKNKYSVNFLDDALKIYNLCEHEVSIAFYTYEQINKLIFDYYTGNKIIAEHRIWTVGYWIPEIFINDIKNSKIHIDYNSYVEGLKSFLLNFSFYGKNKILRDSYSEIKYKEKILENNKNKALIEII